MWLSVYSDINCCEIFMTFDIDKMRLFYYCAGNKL